MRIIEKAKNLKNKLTKCGTAAIIVILILAVCYGLSWIVTCGIITVSYTHLQRPIVGRKPAAVYRYVDLNMDERKPVKVQKKYKNGVILTRAQPFHNGHLNMIKQAASECENLLVVIGSANKSYTKRNPFPIEYRKRLVENVLQEEDLSGADVKVMTLSDWSMEDAAQYVKEWGSFFYYNIANEIGEKSFTFYYNDDPKIAENWFTDDILKNVTIRNLGRSDIEISSTMIRDLLCKMCIRDRSKAAWMNAKICHTNRLQRFLAMWNSCAYLWSPGLRMLSCRENLRRRIMSVSYTHLGWIFSSSCFCVFGHTYGRTLSRPAHI